MSDHDYKILLDAIAVLEKQRIHPDLSIRDQVASVADGLAEVFDALADHESEVAEIEMPY